MDSMYLSAEESFNGERTWKVEKFQFQYTKLDIQKAVKDKSLKAESFNQRKSRNLPRHNSLD